MFPKCKQEPEIMFILGNYIYNSPELAALVGVSRVVLAAGVCFAVGSILCVEYTWARVK